MHSMDQARLLTSSEDSRESHSLVDTRRNEQWSSLDSCIIPNRTRIPSAKTSGNVNSCASQGDLQIAQKLLQIESRINPPSLYPFRNASNQTKSSFTVETSALSDPFRSRTPSGSHFGSKDEKSSRVSSAQSGSDLVLPKSRTAHGAQQHTDDYKSILPSSLEGCNDLNLDIRPRSRKRPNSISEPQPRELSFHTAPIERGIFNPEHVYSWAHQRAAAHCGCSVGLSGRSSSSHLNFDPRNKENRIVNVCQHQLQPSEAKENSNAETEVSHARPVLNDVRKGLRSSATCPALRSGDQQHRSRLRRSSQSAFDLLRSASVASLSAFHHDRPLKGQSVEELARKLGVSPLDLPAWSAPSVLAVPNCFAAPINYLSHINPSADELFVAQLPNHKDVVSYCSAFEDLIRGVEDGSRVIATVAGNHFPKSEGPVNVCAALLRMLAELPAGIIGSSSVFNLLNLAFQSWPKAYGGYKGQRPLARYIVRTLTCIPDLLQIHLVFAVMGFLHGLCKQERDVKLVSRAFGPLLLNDKVNEIPLPEGYVPKKSGTLRRACRKVFRRGLVEATAATKRLETCESVVASCIDIWASVVTEVVENGLILFRER